MKILHVLPTLQIGGAEKFLLRLAVKIAKDPGIEQRFVAIGELGPVGAELVRRGFTVEAMNVGTPAGHIRAAVRLRGIVGQFKPDLIQSWLYRADTLASVARGVHSAAQLVWNLRCSDAPISTSARLARRVCALIADRSPDAIIACGEQVREFHVNLGYPKRKIRVIGNGYDFAPLEDRLLHQGGSIVIGAAGRYDPVKGYDLLIAAIGQLGDAGYNVSLRIAGRGCDASNAELAALVRKAGAEGRVDLVGEVSDMTAFYRSLDMFCLSSRSEGFPNVLVEAMAAGIPAVTTDSGDAAEIAGGHATVVSRGNLAELRSGIETMLARSPRERRDLGLAGASSMRAAYSIDVIAADYLRLYAQLTGLTV